jgi:transcription elongation factor GreA
MDALQLQPPGEPVLAPSEYSAHVRELESLRTVLDRDLPRLLRDARGFVASDASEEIAQIREDHAVIEARIARLEELLRTARVVADDAPPDVVALGRTVEIQYLRSGKVTRYRVTGTGTPATHGQPTVSAASPTGQALLGRSIGEVVSVTLPKGRTEELLILGVGSGS